MLKNKIAVKLSFYFALALLFFAVIIGGIFISLLRNHTINLHREQLTERAQSIASTLSEYMSRNYGMRCGTSYGSYFQFIGEIAGTDVWVVDENLNLITSGMRHGMHGNRAYVYSDLPENAENLIKEVFDGQTVVGEGFSGLFSEATMTVGAPIQRGSSEIIGVVLLHSPITGINSAVTEGIRLLAISLGIALAIAFLLSVWLSKSFTDPIISKEAQDALRLEQTRREFVANISHELKTPITVIRGSLEALIEKVVTDPVKVEEYQRQMFQEATFLQRLVGDLLDLSKLQSVDFVIEKQNIFICEILDDVTRSIQQAANKKNINIAVKTDNTNYMLYGDYGRIRQMLMIILDNAVKFSEESRTIDVVLTNNILSIRDYGAGISEDELPYIFERFYRSRSEQNKQGTGLGLAIAKQIAECHGIMLSAKNDDKVGAVFLLKLP